MDAFLSKITPDVHIWYGLVHVDDAWIVND